MTKQKKCRLCLKKITSENTTCLEEKKLSELLLKIFPGINLYLTNSCEICRGCYNKAAFSIQFQDFVYFKRRYYKEVRQLKITKKMCHICFKDFFKNPTNLLYRLYDNNPISFNLVRSTIELALSQIKFTQDAIFCKFCWKKAKKIYIFKKTCFDTEEMLLKDLTETTKNSKHTTNDVQKYLGEIETLNSPMVLSRYAKNKENTSKSVTKNVEVHVTGLASSQKVVTNNTITRTVTTTMVEVTKVQEAPEVYHNTQEIIETTVIFCEESDSDDIFEEDTKNSDIDDVFDENSEQAIKQESIQSFDNTENEKDPLSSDIEEIASDVHDNDSIIDLTELDEIEKRIKEKEFIDINENHLSDEDIDDIFSEEECSLSDKQEEDKTQKTKSNNTDTTIESSKALDCPRKQESSILLKNSICHSQEQEGECGLSDNQEKDKIQQSLKAPSRKEESEMLLKSSTCHSQKQEEYNLSDKQEKDRKQQTKLSNTSTTSSKALVRPRKRESSTLLKNSTTNSQKTVSNFPKAIFYPPNYKSNSNFNKEVVPIYQKKDAENNLSVFVAVDKTIMEQSSQTTQKTVVGVNFQHTENTVQIASYVKNQNSSNQKNQAITLPSNLSIGPSLQVNNISEEESITKRLKLDNLNKNTVQDNLIKKQNEPKNLVLKRQPKTTCNKGCCGTGTNKTVLIGKIITHVKLKKPVKNKKKKPKLPPLIPIPNISVEPIKTNKDSKINLQVTNVPNTTNKSGKLPFKEYQDSMLNTQKYHITDNSHINEDISVTKRLSANAEHYKVNTTFSNAQTLSTNYTQVQSQAITYPYQYSQMNNNYEVSENINNNYANNNNYYVNNNSYTQSVQTQYESSNMNLSNCQINQNMELIQRQYGSNMSYLSNDQIIQNMEVMNYCCMDISCPRRRLIPTSPTHHEVKWCCHMCMAKFRIRNDLIDHLTYHADPNFYWFHCQKCKFITTSIANVQKHLEYCSMEVNVFVNRSENQRFICHYCWGEFPESLAVHNHLQYHCSQITLRYTLQY